MPNSKAYREKLLALVDAETLEKLRSYNSDFLDGLYSAYVDFTNGLMRGETKLNDQVHDAIRRQRNARIDSVIGDLTDTNSIYHAHRVSSDFREAREDQKKAEDMLEIETALRVRIGKVRMKIRDIKAGIGKDALKDTICAGIIAGEFENYGAAEINDLLSRLWQAAGLPESDDPRNVDPVANADAILVAYLSEWRKAQKDGEMEGMLQALAAATKDYLTEIAIEDAYNTAEGLLCEKSTDCKALSDTHYALSRFKADKREDIREMCERLNARRIEVEGNKACEEARALLQKNRPGACREAAGLLKKHEKYPEAVRLRQEALAAYERLHAKQVRTRIIAIAATAIVIAVLVSFFGIIRPLLQ